MRKKIIKKNAAIYFVNIIVFLQTNKFAAVIEDQEILWRETPDDTPTTEAEARRGGITQMEVDSKMLHDISSLVSRLVAKSNQLIGNHTTNLAECWMHIRTKFDGGKIINRSQSGSWEHRLVVYDI